MVSHKNGTYWINTNDGYALVELEDGGIETGWYRKQGMAKQPAIERAIESHKKMVDWIEDYVQGNVSYGCFEVRILRPDEYEDQGEDATPVCDAGPLVELEDGGIETGWYRKQGMAKQPAIERAIESRKKMVDWIENYVQGNVSYGCFEVRILRPDEYEVQGEDATHVCDAGPLGGVECDDDEYLLGTLNELFNEATHRLTL